MKNLQFIWREIRKKINNFKNKKVIKRKVFNNKKTRKTIAI